METRLGSQNISALPKQSTKEAAWVQGLSFRAPRQLPQLPTGPAANPTLNQSLPSSREQRCHKHGRFRQCARSSGDSGTLGFCFCFFCFLHSHTSGRQPAAHTALSGNHPSARHTANATLRHPSAFQTSGLRRMRWGKERDTISARVWALLGSIRLPQSLSCLFRPYFSQRHWADAHIHTHSPITVGFRLPQIGTVCNQNYNHGLQILKKKV